MSHCNPGWCELKAGGYKGWLKREELWGLEQDEVLQ
jgi:SH3-like domain-containing protein